MRVGLVIYGTLETISGGFLYDRMLVNYLRRQGDRVEILSLPWRTYAHHLLDNAWREILRSFEQAPVDILIQDELCHPSLFWFNKRYRRRRPKTPIISLVHHLRCSEARAAWKNRLYRMVERRYLLSVDGFIYNSQDTQKTVEGVMGEEKPAVVAVPGGDQFSRGLTDEQITRRVKAAGPLQIIFLGNLIHRKGLHTLIAALATLPPQSWCLTAVGDLTMDPVYVRSLKRLIEQSGLRDRLTFTGPLRDDELAERLAQSHVLAVPSTYEGYGIAYLEGMSFGLPAIATTAGGAKEIITHGQDGFLIAPEDTDALADCLGNLVHDREQLLAMSLAARATFAAHPTWEDSCRSIHRFLHGFQYQP